MALDAGSLVFVAYDRDALSADPTEGVLGILTDAFDKKVTVEEDGLGAGEFSISPNSAQAAWCTPGTYVRAYRNDFGGQPLAGFLLDTGSDDLLSPDEEGGLVLRRTGPGPIATLAEALVWHRALLGSGAVVVRERGFWRFRDSHPARVLIRLLREAQRRGAIPHVGWDFTTSEDSGGVAWSDAAVETYRVDIGQDLMEVTDDLRETGFHVGMGPNFVLHAYDAYENDVTNSVSFEAGVNIRETAERAIAARRARSVVLMEGDAKDGDARYLAVGDEDAEAALGRRREGFFRYERTATAAALRRTGRRRLRRWRTRGDGVPTLGVIDTTGMVALVDYTVGDAVDVHIPGTYEHAALRIVAVTLVEGEDGTYDPVLELGDLPGEHASAGVGGHPGGDDGNAPEHAAAAADPRLLDGFSRTVDPPGTIAGSSLGVSWARYQLAWGQAPFHYAGAEPVAGAPIAPSLTALGGGQDAYVDSVAGPHNHPWPSVACGIGFGAWSAWREREAWYRLAVPAHPGSMAGVRLAFGVDAAWGAAAAAGCVVRVRHTAPTEGRQGAVVGRVAGTGVTSVLVPGAHVPAEGGALWVGLGPDWEADTDFSEAQRPGGGTPYACVISPTNPQWSGENGSGMLRIAVLGAAAWELFTDAGGSMGTIA